MEAQAPINRLTIGDDSDTLNDPLDAVIQIAEERRGYLHELKDALTADDTAKLKIYARKLVGMPEPAIVNIDA